MKLAPIFFMLWLTASPALAHGYRFGDLEIIHPTVMVPSQRTDCSCAHVKIINHGSIPEYFLGAVISAASQTHLISIAPDGGGLTMPARLEIRPGGTLDLTRDKWCLFMSGIVTALEADMGAVPGQLLFENHGPAGVEFMIDEAK